MSDDLFSIYSSLRSSLIFGDLGLVIIESSRTEYSEPFRVYLLSRKFNYRFEEENKDLGVSERLYLISEKGITYYDDSVGRDQVFEPKLGTICLEILKEYMVGPYSRNSSIELLLDRKFRIPEKFDIAEETLESIFKNVFKR